MNKDPDFVLQERWQYVRKTFFPRWDRDHRWTIIYNESRPSHGYCNSESRQIEIGVVCNDEDQFQLLLIHETCHALKRGSQHGTTWQRYMLKKARIAARLGRNGLADLLRKEVADYQKAHEMGVGSYQDVYSRIQDIVMENPDVTYERLLAHVSREFGFFPNEFEKQFKRCQKVYYKAMRKYAWLREKIKARQKR